MVGYSDINSNFEDHINDENNYSLDEFISSIIKKISIYF